MILPSIDFLRFLIFTVSLNFIQVTLSNPNRRGNWNGGHNRNRNPVGNRGGGWTIPLNRPAINNRHNPWGDRPRPLPSLVETLQNFESCPRPVLAENDGELRIEKCQENEEQRVCWDSSIEIPIGWKVTLLCKQGKIRLRQTSTCSEDGQWSKSFPTSCQPLFDKYADLAQKSSKRKFGKTPLNSIPQKTRPSPATISQNIGTGKILTPNIKPDEKHCPMLQMQQSSGNFEFLCYMHHQSPAETLDCISYRLVPSGTIAVLRCKPPFYNQAEWVCSDGKWEGGFERKLRCVLSHQGSIPTQPSKKEPVTIPTTPRPVFKTPLKTIPTTPRPIPTTSLKTTSTTESSNFYLFQDYGEKPVPVTEGLREPDLPPTENIRTTEKSFDADDIFNDDNIWEELFPDEDDESSPDSDPDSDPSMTTESKTTTTTTTPSISTTTSKSSVTCPPLRPRSDRMKLECVSRTKGSSTKSEQVLINECDLPQQVGAEATYSCKQFFESAGGLVNVYRKCKEDGTWSGNADSFSCIAECGRKNEVFVPYITSGSPTFKGEWPWHAALFINSSGEWEYNCGGTLISRKCILTAAHCVTFRESVKVRPTTSFRFDVGRQALNETDEDVQTLQVESIHIHSSYSPYGYDSDIAIIILKEAVHIGYFVRPACFPQSVNTEDIILAEGSTGTVVGWGFTETGELSTTLKKAKLKVVGPRECSKGNSGRSQIRSTTYCAAPNVKNETQDGKLVEKSVNVCNGDSGGGMSFPTTTSTSDFPRWFLQGIVSVGIGDKDNKCLPNQYSYFTRVGRYADWLVRVLSENDAL